MLRRVKDILDYTHIIISSPEGKYDDDGGVIFYWSFL
jgi:hypothetical protein